MVMVRKIACPNCRNEVELRKGIIAGEEFGFCEKCKHLVLIGYNSKDEMTHFDPRNSAFINYLLAKARKSQE